MEYAVGVLYAVKCSHGSVKAELIARASYVCNLCAQDDQMLYKMCKDTFQGFYLSLILSGKIEQRNQSDNACIPEGIATYGGRDRGEMIITSESAILQNIEYLVTGKHSTKIHIFHHKRALIKLCLAEQ